MGFTSFKVVSGHINYPKMNLKMDAKTFAIVKAHVWLDMLNEGKRPTKWFKTNTKGTKVAYDYMYSQEEYDAGLDELDTYMYEVNKKYNVGLKISSEK